MKIYTKTGDDGSTGLYGGSRVSKADLRVEAYGTVDETNAAIGLARAADLSPGTDVFLARVQSSLFDLGAALAIPAGEESKSPPPSDQDVEALERAIDAAEAGLTPLRNFVLPGGSEAAARLHVARTVCRRAERLVVLLAASEVVDPVIVRYLNRLSDMLFVQARAANAARGLADTPWHPSPK